MKNLELNEKSLVYHLKQYRAKKFLKYYPETTSTNDIGTRFIICSILTQKSSGPTTYL